MMSALTNCAIYDLRFPQVLSCLFVLHTNMQFQLFYIVQLTGYESSVIDIDRHHDMFSK